MRVCAASNQPGTDYSLGNFLGAAFSSGERSAILATDVVNANNTYNGTAGGADTRDRVFLLSEAEVYSTFHGFASGYSTYDEARRCKPTDFARAMGAWKSTSSGYEGNCWWWLRSPGGYSSGAAGVHDDGYVYRNGSNVDHDSRAVRPALNLNLASPHLSWAGTVSSNGDVDEQAAPDDEAPSFSDVTDKTAHAEDITWLAEQGISKGWDMPDGTVQFRPYANVARADMAAFLFRLAKSWGLVADGWEPAGTASFTDVTAKTAHCDEIMWLAESGISQGWAVEGGREFRPYANVARADMAAFLHRLANLAKVEGPAGGGATFKDVTAKTAHADDIAWLAATGVSKGWSVSGGYEFRPLANVARADMAAFLHRLDGLR